MKCKICFAVLLMILCLSPAHADNNIMIMVDTIWSSTYNVPVGFENEDTLQGLSNGCRISASGDVVAWFILNAAYVDTISRDGLLPTSAAWAFRYCGDDTLKADTVLAGSLLKGDMYMSSSNGEENLSDHSNNSVNPDRNCDEANSNGDEYG